MQAARLDGSYSLIPGVDCANPGRSVAQDGAADPRPVTKTQPHASKSTKRNAAKERGLSSDVVKQSYDIVSQRLYC
jgi:hypothetical protein